MQTESKNWLSWLVWFSSALFVSYQFLLQASTSVMIPGLMHSFRLSVSDVGVLSASFFYPYVLLQIPAGLLVDRLGVRRPLIFSVLLCLVTTLVFAVSRSALIAEIARLLMGMASAPAVVCAMCLACRWFAPAQFALLAGMVEMLGMFGGAFGQYSISLLVHQFSWRGSMLVCAAIAVLLLLLVIIFIKDWPSEKHREEYCQTHECVLPAETFWHRIQLLLQQPQIWLACLYGGLIFGLVTAFTGLWAVPFLELRYHITDSSAALASSLMFIGVGLGAPGMGWISSRWLNYRIVMLSASVFTLGLFYWIVWGSASYWLCCLLMLLLGCTVGAYAISFAVVKSVTPPSAHGTAIGYTNMMVIFLGAPIFQPLIGYVLQHFSEGGKAMTLSEYHMAFSVLAACVAVAAVLSCFIKSEQ